MHNYKGKIGCACPLLNYIQWKQRKKPRPDVGKCSCLVAEGKTLFMTSFLGLEGIDKYHVH